jgi:hypothetical protein
LVVSVDVGCAMESFSNGSSSIAGGRGIVTRTAHFSFVTGPCHHRTAYYAGHFRNAVVWSVWKAWACCVILAHEVIEGT